MESFEHNLKLELYDESQLTQTQYYYPVLNIILQS